MDNLTAQQRHKNMANIRLKDTRPELLARKWLWSHGYRYRLNVKSVPGKPDIVLRRYRTAIFVNGCFWHGHEECGNFKAPKNNTVFWLNKITKNKERDQRNYRDLFNAGWNVIVIWECQLRNNRIEETMRNVEHLLSNNLLGMYKAHSN